MSKIKWHTIHNWAGLKLSFLLSFILITGTLATVSHEIDWLLDNERRIEKPSNLEDIEWDKAIQVAQMARPAWMIEEMHAPLNEYSIIEAIGLTANGERRRLFIHPKTYQIQGEASWINVQRFLRDTHRRLFIMNDWGILLVSSLSLLLMTSLISGILVYKKFWRGFFKRPRRTTHRLFWGDMHRLTAIWSLWFISMIGVTSLWYLTEAALEKWADDPSVYEKGAPSVAFENHGQTLLALKKSISLSNPAFSIRLIKLPIADDDTLEIQGAGQSWLTRPRANLYAYSGSTREILHEIKGENLSPLQRIVEMADFLHFGTWGGLCGKILYFLFGCILSGLALSGLYIYAKRINAQSPGKNPTLSKAMGFYKYGALIILVYWLLQIPNFVDSIGNGRQLSGTLTEFSLAKCKMTLGLTSNKATLKIDPLCAKSLSWPRGRFSQEEKKKFKLGSKGLSLKAKSSSKTFTLILTDSSGHSHRKIFALDKLIVNRH
ncbi:PepSY-associated TM helix domain-containing protein [Temperatibacter marinus]|uniref:PepSY-associated TM helix domain-containing protein n=1 Tax=Temperatibacter marinus TaxID=1456591 RepID=A0AA52EEW5_9PROT|nr:PepSY-associated TM helix domain-containing protein [Temperatibacter marinus]WND01818.1 PepSY-associated TM helix domain-containing protein [Temperatibacter marinus]